MSFSLGLDGFSSSPTAMSASVSHSSRPSASEPDSKEPVSLPSAASRASPEMCGNTYTYMAVFNMPSMHVCYMQVCMLTAGLASHTHIAHEPAKL